ncbi:MAG: rod shape-determining protein RodA [Candidatus Omnitrophica bacterium]|nr:rod shape-determining protein RodA [Candidatus Omnitrophota bacterium]
MRPVARLDWLLALSTLWVVALGFLILVSASYQLTVFSGKFYVMRQALWVGLGIILCVVFLRIPTAYWFDIAPALYVLAVALLAIVLVAGRTHFGAQRWLTLGPLAFQPSELSKIAVILFLARYLGRRTPQFDLSKGVGGAFLIVYLPALLVLKQPDLGTALTLLPVAFAMLWAWGLPARWWLGCAGFHAACAPLLWFILKDYQKKRLLIFLNPYQDPYGSGYSIIQSKIAIGSGGLFGKGWLEGTQNQLNFLPAHHTDFIFSVIGEEWGLAGCALLLLLYWVLVWRGLRVAEAQSEPMARLLGVGLVSLLMVHIFVNIGMTMGLMPVVGLPLPLISYGGSFLLITFLAIGMLLGMSYQRNA